MSSLAIGLILIAVGAALIAAAIYLGKVANKTSARIRDRLMK